MPSSADKFRRDNQKRANKIKTFNSSRGLSITKKFGPQKIAFPEFRKFKRTRRSLKLLFFTEKTQTVCGAPQIVLTLEYYLDNV